MKSVLKSDCQLTVLKKTMMNHISNFKLSNSSYFEINKPLRFDHHATISKVMTERKGLCIELNYTYSRFLLQNGFGNMYFVNCQKLDLLGKRYYSLFHNGLVVGINNNKYYVDVGLGDYFIEPKLMDKNNYVNNNFFVRDNNKEILKVIDKPITMDEINDNYVMFFDYKEKDFPFCNRLYERIFDTRIMKYSFPKE